MRTLINHDFHILRIQQEVNGATAGQHLQTALR